MSVPTEITNIFDHDWDLLIILDACRLDLMEEVAPDYDFIERVDSIYSVAAQSAEWMETTFSRQYTDEIQETAVVTGNPYSQTCLDADDVVALDEVWKYAWDDELGTVPARPITNRAVTYARDNAPDRLLVHYMQPHFPCVPRPRPSSGIELNVFGTRPMPIWRQLKTGTLTTEQVWQASLRNLRYVLDDVALLLENVDAQTVIITADHGDSHGENGQYGHPPGSRFDVVRKVPWVRTTASDERTFEPEEYDSEEQHVSQDEVLRALGYQ